MDRLFVPLNTKPYEWFERAQKEWELRVYGPKFNEQYVKKGRIVELRKGYSGASLWGVIEEVVIGTLDEVLAKVDFKKIVPVAQSEEEARTSVKNILPPSEQYIAFKVSQMSDKKPSNKQRTLPFA